MSEDARLALISHLRKEASAVLAENGEPVKVVELTAGDCSLRLERPDPASDVVAQRTAVVQSGPAEPVPAEPGPGEPVHTVRAPLVGSFYRRPAPDATPFVEVDDVVEAGQTLAIIEAMKLMNEITSDRPGRVVAVRPTDGQMVEFDEVLVELEEM